MALSLLSSEPSCPLSSSTYVINTLLDINLSLLTYSFSKDSCIMFLKSFDLVHYHLFKSNAKVMLNMLLEFINSKLHGLHCVNDRHLWLHIFSQIFMQCSQFGSLICFLVFIWTSCCHLVLLLVWINDVYFRHDQNLFALRAWFSKEVSPSFV